MGDLRRENAWYLLKWGLSAHFVVFVVSPCRFLASPFKSWGHSARLGALCEVPLLTLRSVCPFWGQYHHSGGQYVHFGGPCEHFGVIFKGAGMDLGASMPIFWVPFANDGVCELMSPQTVLKPSKAP